MTRDEYNLYGKIITAARGVELPHAKLDEEKIKRIRANVRGKTAKQLASEYGVHVRTIEKVNRRLSWTHV